MITVPTDALFLFKSSFSSKPSKESIVFTILSIIYQNIFCLFAVTLNTFSKEGLGYNMFKL